MFPSLLLPTVLLMLLLSSSSFSNAFVPLEKRHGRQMPSFTVPSSRAQKGSAFSLSKSGRGNISNKNNNTPSKRQERVSQLIQTELSRILHSGTIKGGRRSSGDNDATTTNLSDSNRKAISVVNVNVSPDLRQARVSVSIRAPTRIKQSPSETEDEASSYSTSSMVEKRKTFSWLVQNTKAIKHTLAQRISHLKSCPDLTFTEVNVGAAVDVMYLIDKVSAGYKRDDVLSLSSIDGMDVEDFDWEEDDDDDEEDNDSGDFFL